MQSAIDKFEETYSVPQIQKDRLGRYQFMPVRTGIKDCCGFCVSHFQRVGEVGCLIKRRLSMD